MYVFYIVLLLYMLIIDNFSTKVCLCVFVCLK